MLQRSLETKHTLAARGCAAALPFRCRTGEEFQGGHVPGAVNVPVWVKPQGGGEGMQENKEFVQQVGVGSPSGNPSF